MQYVKYKRIGSRAALGGIEFSPHPPATKISNLSQNKSYDNSLPNVKRPRLI